MRDVFGRMVVFVGSFNDTDYAAALGVGVVRSSVFI
jgi:hypothetical protein